MTGLDQVVPHHLWALSPKVDGRTARQLSSNNSKHSLPSLPYHFSSIQGCTSSKMDHNGDFSLGLEQPQMFEDTLKLSSRSLNSMSVKHSPRSKSIPTLPGGLDMNHPSTVYGTGNSRAQRLSLFPPSV